MMRKLMVGLMVVGLLAVAAPATAQGPPTPGSLDPLGLITSGAVLPYFGGGNNQSWLEVYAPVSGTDFHMFFFNETCVRGGDSVGIDLTTNDVEFLRVDNLGGAIPTTGLVTGASADNTGFFLVPLQNPVHARMLWVDVGRNFVRVIDPIAASVMDSHGSGWWNPLRTAANFFAPLEGGAFSTTIYLVCPNDNIARTGSASTSRAFATANGFPPLVPAPVLPGGTTPLRIRVYDDEEKFLRDVTVTCNCLSTLPVTSISTVYSSVVSAPNGTYTEVEGGTIPGSPPVCSTTEIVATTAANPCPVHSTGFKFKLITPEVPAGGPYSFTGYRAIRAGNFDVFGRLNNAYIGNIQGGFSTSSR